MQNPWRHLYVGDPAGGPVWPEWAHGEQQEGPQRDRSQFDTGLVGHVKSLDFTE